MTIGLSSSGYSSECRKKKEKDREEQEEEKKVGTSQRGCAMAGMEMVVK